MISARDFSQLMLGDWHGRYGACACPVCQPERRKGQNALTVADGRNGRLVLDCKKSSCAFLDILAAAGLRSGDYTPPDAATIAQREREAKTEREKRAARAKRLWQEAQPIAGTLAETYLRGRGITCALPDTLRFHPACWHPTTQRLPAMVAMVDGTGLLAVHRTYLQLDGSGKALVEPAKAMLGAVRGGALRVTTNNGPLVVAEGIETALSLACGILPGPATIWAALSTSGIRALRLLDTPGRLIVATDGDAAGKAAGQALAKRAASLGWAATLLCAPEGCDWNDVLRTKGGVA